MGRIFVRERRAVRRGTGQPRYVILAVEGLDLQVYHSHVRKLELDKLAEILAAELVFLPRGDDDPAESEFPDGSGQGRRRGGRGRHRGMGYGMGQPDAPAADDTADPA
jgi:hypothetical protein